MTAFDRLGEQLAREQDALLEQHNAQSEVRERLNAADWYAAASVRPWLLRPRVLWPSAGAMSLAIAALAFLSLRSPHAQTVPLTVHLDANEELLQVGQFVEAPTLGQAALRFSDGSRIEVAERGRARLVGLKNTGADVLLESGQMHVKVQHRDDSSWHIGAGPFAVHVTGTRFDVRWTPEEDAFELTLHEGLVEVSGCAIGAGYHVQAGQTVRASCRTERFEVRSAADIGTTARGVGNAPEFGQAAPAAQNESAENTATSPAEVPVTSAPAAPLLAAPVPAAASPHETDRGSASARGPTAASDNSLHRPADWQTLARAGRYVQALRLVRTSGFEQECARVNAEELSLLANVARYGQDGEGEGHALRVLRERFRGTKRAGRAAFALGRLEFDNHGAYAEAAEWFRIYLREQPRGEFSREAQGRLLEATQRAGNTAAARDLATRYLVDYPQGPHAELARALSAGL